MLAKELDIFEDFKIERFSLHRSVFTKSELKKMWFECQNLSHNFYNLESIKSHKVYFSDDSEGRTSHAMMIAERESKLPYIPLESGLIGSFFQLYKAYYNKHLNFKLPPDARAMLNWQEYREKSKPVPMHFDGEFINYKKHLSGEFSLYEAVLPRLVAILVIENKNYNNAENGIVLTNLQTGISISPRLQAGDIIFFDNIFFRHHVPSLKNPRKILGLRCFDFDSFHYVSNLDYKLHGHSYSKIPEGHISYLENSRNVLSNYLTSGWPRDYLKSLKEGTLI